MKRKIISKQIFGGRFGRSFGCLLIFLSMACVSPSFAFQSPSKLELHRTQVMIRGLTFLRTGFPDKAAAEFAEGLRVSPTNTTLLSSMADAQFAMGDFGLAAFYIESALKEEPDNVFWLRQALLISLEAGNAENAIRYSSHLLELEPQDVASHIAHLELLDRLQHRAQATIDAEASMVTFTSNEKIQRTALRIFLDSGALNLALVAAKRLVSLTSDPDDMFEVASVLIQLDDKDAARAVLAEIIRIDASHQDAIQALEELNNPPSKENDFFGANAVAVPNSETPRTSEKSETLVISDTILASHTIETLEDLGSKEAAEALLKSNQFDELARFASSQIDADPRRLEMWIYALQGHIASENYDSAILLAEDGVLLFPGYPPLLYQYARALSKLLRFPEAIKAATSALQGATSDPDLKAKIEGLLIDIQQHQ
mgnify:CR=1 FL=1|jgi:tetratricopeptide (TPR) repeat protein